MAKSARERMLPVPFIEVARVLKKDGLHDHMPNDDAADVVCILAPKRFP
jgi:hypothetical protein